MPGALGPLSTEVGILCVPALFVELLQRQLLEHFLIWARNPLMISMKVYR